MSAGNLLANAVTEREPRDEPNDQLTPSNCMLQSRIDQYHRERSGEPLDLGDYERFLRDIGYVLLEGNDFAIRTTNVDDEIAVVAGPQLVVPLSNARYALNAANARWGSLYDALYGTDAIPEDGGATRTATYNTIRGGRVVARHRLGRARRQYPIGPPYVFAMDVPVGMSQGLRQASPYGLAAWDGLAATVANVGQEGHMDLPCRIPATNCEMLARFSPQTAKPKPLRRNTPEAGVR
jgi:malate synthase